jgi:curved DNA-binding protein CbpA
MFVDYYAVLQIPFSASDEEIKIAFKKQALKWHPDRNPGQDTHERMILINEAYVLLRDVEARERYNQEYIKFKDYQQQSEERKQQRKEHQKQYQQSEPSGQSEKRQDYKETFEDSSYEFFDDTLKRWMSNARSQATNLAKQTIEDMIGMSKVSGKAMGEAALGGIVRYLIFGFIMLIIFKACQN